MKLLTETFDRVTTELEKNLNGNDYVAIFFGKTLTVFLYTKTGPRYSDVYKLKFSDVGIAPFDLSLFDIVRVGRMAGKKSISIIKNKKELITLIRKC